MHIYNVIVRGIENTSGAGGRSTVVGGVACLHVQQPADGPGGHIDVINQAEEGCWWAGVPNQGQYSLLFQGDVCIACNFQNSSPSFRTNFVVVVPLTCML